MFFIESSENSHLCPICQGMLRYRDSRPRIRKKEGGVVITGVLECGRMIRWQKKSL
ncbi:hypothetical protein NE606_03555 [Agathobaculum butyriciproducens]|nr:hypothetical protein [Agathobaculum butyriciproducens]